MITYPENEEQDITELKYKTTYQNNKDRFKEFITPIQNMLNVIVRSKKLDYKLYKDVNGVDLKEYINDLYNILIILKKYS